MILQVYVDVNVREILPGAPEELIEALNEINDENAEEIRGIEEDLEQAVSNRTRSKVCNTIYAPCTSTY